MSPFKRNQYGMYPRQLEVDQHFKKELEEMPVVLILGVHVRGSMDRATQKSILRHWKLNKRSLESTY